MRRLTEVEEGSADGRLSVHICINSASARRSPRTWLYASKTEQAMRANARMEMMEAAMASARRGDGGLSSRSRAVRRTAARACDAVTMDTSVVMVVIVRDDTAHDS